MTSAQSNTALKKPSSKYRLWSWRLVFGLLMDNKLIRKPVVSIMLLFNVISITQMSAACTKSLEAIATIQTFYKLYVTSDDES